MAEESKTKKNIKKSYIFAVGRRREAVARVRLYPHIDAKVQMNDKPLEKGDIFVNNKPISEYFRFRGYTPEYMSLLTDIDAHGKFGFTIKVAGGGLSGQLDAVVLGMARAVEKVDEKYRTMLKAKGYFTRDPRVRERRKVGMGGKARRKRQSPKR